MREDYAGYLKLMSEQMWRHFPFRAAGRMLTQLIGPSGSGEGWLAWVRLFRHQDGRFPVLDHPG